MLSEEDLNYIFQALAHETRRRIVKLLAEEGPMQFTELMKRLGIEETGTLGFHIRRLRELLEDAGSEGYRLSKTGLLAYKIIKYAEEGAEEEKEFKTSALGIKVFKGLRRLLVNGGMLREHGKVGFEHIVLLAFAEDVDEDLFKDKVLYFRHIGKILVPKRLVKIAYGRLWEWCGDIIGYEDGLPSIWEEEKRIKDLDNYGGVLILSRDRLERERDEGYRLRIENYGTLIIERDVEPELFDDVILSIDSYGPIYAPKRLHKLISDKAETLGEIHSLEEKAPQQY